MQLSVARLVASLAVCVDVSLFSALSLEEFLISHQSKWGFMVKKIGTGFSLQRLFNMSAVLTKTESPFGYWSSRVFFSQDRRKILFLLYAYFRWVDDTVDKPDFNLDFNHEFIHRQTTIIQAWYMGESAVLSENLFETMAATAIKEDKKNGSQLQSMITGFLEAIAWDVERRNKIVNQIELDRYSLLLGRSYSEGLLYGLKLNPCESTYSTPKTLCGVAAHWSHLLRDLSEDLKLGYINISDDDIKQYSINLKNSQTLLPWIREKCCRTLDMFAEGRKSRSLLPTHKAQIVFDLNCLKHISNINKIINRIDTECS